MYLHVFGHKFFLVQKEFMSKFDNYFKTNNYDVTHACVMFHTYVHNLFWIIEYLDILVSDY